MNRKPPFLALLALPLLLLGLFAFWPKPREKPRAVADTAPSVWDRLAYTEISRTAEFRQQLAGALERETAKLAAWPAGHTAKLADLINDYLCSLQSGDFELYWRFRAPTGRSFIGTESAAELRKFIRGQQQGAGVSYCRDDQLDDLRDPKQLMALTWRLMAFPKEHNGIKVVGCTSCYRATALGDIQVGLIPAKEFDTRALMKRFSNHVRIKPTKGFIVQAGAVRSLPEQTLEIARHPEGIHFIAVLLPIRMDTGHTLPVYLFAYWNGTEDRFIPMAHGLGDSTAKAPRVLF